jgi:hypothetical protein
MRFIAKARCALEANLLTEIAPRARVLQKVFHLMCRALQYRTGQLLYKPALEEPGCILR